MNLIKDQGIFPWVIILLILITLSLDNVWILLGENCYWSLLELKGLMFTAVIFMFHSVWWQFPMSEFWKTSRRSSLNKSCRFQARFCYLSDTTQQSASESCYLGLTCNKFFSDINGLSFPSTNKINLQWNKYLQQDKTKIPLFSARGRQCSEQLEHWTSIIGGPELTFHPDNYSCSWFSSQQS